MDFKNFLGNCGKIRGNFCGFGRLKIKFFAEFNEKFGEFRVGFLNFAMENSAKFLNLLNLRAENSKITLNLTANLEKMLNLAKNSSIAKTKKGLLYENENPA